jgi:hypothetical protein
VAEEENSVSEDEDVETQHGASGDDDDRDDEDFAAHVMVRP